MHNAAAIASLEAGLSNRPIPESWQALLPTVAGGTIGDVIAVVRNHHEPASDVTIRALLASPPGGRIDPRTVLLVALAPRTMRWRPRKESDTQEVLAELAGIVCDTGRVEGLDRLFLRLISRASKRQARSRISDREVPIGETGRLEYGNRAPRRPISDVEDQALDRVALSRFKRAVEAAILDGEVRPMTWQRLLHGPLAGTVAVSRSGLRRGNTTRERRQIRPIADRHLAS